MKRHDTAKARTRPLPFRAFLLSCLIALAAPGAAFACPVCFGNVDSPMATATNMGIFAMLIVVAGVLGAFATFFIYLMRRARLVRLADDARSTTSEGTV